MASGFSVGWLALIFAVAIEGARLLEHRSLRLGGSLFGSLGTGQNSRGIFVACPPAERWEKAPVLVCFPVGFEKVTVGSKCRKTGVTLTLMTVRPKPPVLRVSRENRNFDGGTLALVGIATILVVHSHRRRGTGSCILKVPLVYSDACGNQPNKVAPPKQ